LFYLKQATQLAFVAIVFSASSFFVYARIQRKAFSFGRTWRERMKAFFFSLTGAFGKLKKLWKRIILI